MPFPAFFLLAAALGGREVLRSKRRGRKMLDAEADRIDAINNIDIGLNAMGGGNLFDAAQIEIMTRQKHTAQGFLASKDPAQQRLGATMLQSISTAARANIQQNETEARADEQRELDEEIRVAGLGLAANEKRFDRGIKMNEQLNNELKPFGEAMLRYDKVTNLLDGNDQLASLAALTAFVQAIDGSVVREAELLKYQGSNGLITQFVNLVNKGEGVDFDEGTKQQIRNAAAALMNAEKGRAMAIANSYQDRAVNWGLSVDGVMSGIDRSLFTPIQITAGAEQEMQAQADQAEAAMASFVEVPGQTNLATVADKILQVWFDTGRAARGATLHIDEDTGDIWEKDADGAFSRIEGTRDMRRKAELMKLRSGQVKLSPDAQRRIDEGELDEPSFFDRFERPSLEERRRRNRERRQ